MKIGANYLGNGICEFAVWAPAKAKVELQFVLPQAMRFPLQKDETGYWKTTVKDFLPGPFYLFRLDDEIERPDPASHFQPRGVHGPSQVIDHTAFQWQDGNWRGIDLAQMVIYELHVGAFTPEGTFAAILPRLGELKDLGVNAIELMPVAQFPGERNWGYDGVYPFAVQNSYGVPADLKTLVNACHQTGLAVILDVVYNHLGPEGNYFSDFGPYFTGKYKTPWGKALNFDEAHSDPVRNYFIENALHWLANYHIDALRLDAVHAIFDMSARPFLRELAENVEAFSARAGRRFYLIAESNTNDIKVINPRLLGGYGIEAQWCDDFHHALHTLLTGENQGYYGDFGKITHLAKALREGFVFSGQYSSYRGRRHGSSSKDRPAKQFVVCAQNHDQIGNRRLGERLSQLLSFERLKLAAGAVLLSPYVPLLFMGEEYGEDAPFLYFVSHSDAELIEAVRKGRKEEFKAFHWQDEPPDPQSVETFLRSKLQWEKRKGERHLLLLNFYKTLIKLRRDIPALSYLDKDSLEVTELGKIILTQRCKMEDHSHVFCLFNFNHTDTTLPAGAPEGRWKKILDSSETIWGGSGTWLPEQITPDEKLTLRANGCAVFIKE
jgi:maltooligosyltrehalose trehalohydrolase